MQEPSAKKIYVIIPVINNGKVIQKVLKEIKDDGYYNIIVVDDGSEDDSYEKAKAMNAIVLKHMINRGKDAAVKTGIEAAKILNADIAVTMDGDGRHNPKDIRQMVDLINNGIDVVLGSRFLNGKEMPWPEWLTNHLDNFLTWLANGLWVTDNHSNFRAYSKRAIEVIYTENDRYERDSEVLREIHRKRLKYWEVPIEVRHDDHSRSRPPKPGLKNGIKTMIRSLIS
ncbi:MAG: glycosyltransferase family 2 protein [Thermodesulfobacteriota bacterium]